MRRNTTEAITRLTTCHGTMQEISYEWLVVKRYDFNATLKLSIDCLARICCGSRFHSEGAATANERTPNFVAVLATTRSSLAADLSLRLASTEDTGWHMSAR